MCKNLLSLVYNKFLSMFGGDGVTKKVYVLGMSMRTEAGNRPKGLTIQSLNRIP